LAQYRLNVLFVLDFFKKMQLPNGAKTAVALDFDLVFGLNDWH